eukprot:1382-Pleurochrysis_carterae.AAC.1
MHALSRAPRHDSSHAKDLAMILVPAGVAPARSHASKTKCEPTKARRRCRRGRFQATGAARRVHRTGRELVRVAKNPTLPPRRHSLHPQFLPLFNTVRCCVPAVCCCRRASRRSSMCCSCSRRCCRRRASCL